MLSLRRAVVLGLLIPAAAAAQQPMTLRVALRQDAVFHYRTDIETWVVAPGTAMDSTHPTTSLRLFSTRTVKVVRNDTAIVQDVVDSATAATPGVQGAHPANAEAAATAMRGVTTLSAIDGRGRLLDYAAGTQHEQNLSAPVQAFLPMAGLLRVVFALPANPVKTGDTWTESQSGSDPSGSVTMTANYTLERTTTHNGHTLAIIGSTGTIGGGGRGGALASQFTGHISYDINDSQPTGFWVDIKGTVSSGGQSIPLRVRRTVTRL
jgi:hypothetical protein